jgi:hypothetical protein
VNTVLFGREITAFTWLCPLPLVITRIQYNTPGAPHAATQAAIGLATVHNIDREGEASVAHTDISPAQYVNVNGVYKLNDFNRARFIAYSPSESCAFLIGSNPGKNRSPEEYAYEPQTEKVSHVDGRKRYSYCRECRLYQLVHARVSYVSTQGRRILSR